MATTVNNAFSKFMKDIVNLDSTQTEKARKSRDNLKNNIHDLGGTSSFFNLASSNDLYFGSFSRKTKIRELILIVFLLLPNGLSKDLETYCCI